MIYKFLGFDRDTLRIFRRTIGASSYAGALKHLAADSRAPNLRIVEVVWLETNASVFGSEKALSVDELLEAEEVHLSEHETMQVLSSGVTSP